MKICVICVKSVAFRLVIVTEQTFAKHKHTKHRFDVVRTWGERGAGVGWLVVLGFQFDA